MTQSKRDPLLTAAKLLTLLLMGVTALVTAFLVVLVPLLLLNQAEMAKEVTAAGGDFASVLAVALLLIVSAGIIVAMAFHFFQLLGRVIDTVSEGDPFTADNAKRLTRMGWIALIFQIASFPIAAMALYVEKFSPQENMTLDIDFSLTGVLLAIVLFILARVFRHGAAMRDDLEGTV